MSKSFQEKQAGTTKTLKPTDFPWLAQNPRATESTVLSWLEREGWKDGFGLDGSSQGFFKHPSGFLLMECPLSPQGGPCGVLAAVQACVLQQLIFAESNRNKDTR